MKKTKKYTLRTVDELQRGEGTVQRQNSFEYGWRKTSAK